MVHACNPGIWEAETGGLPQVLSQENQKEKKEIAFGSSQLMKKLWTGKKES